MKTPLYKRYGFWIAVILLAVLIFLGIELTIELTDVKVSEELTVEQCQEIVDKSFTSLPKSKTSAAKHIIDNTKITVDSVEYGYEKDIILSCTYQTVNTKKALMDQLEGLMESAYGYSEEKTKASGSDIDLRCVRKPMLEYIRNAETVTGNVKMCIYETAGKYTLYLNDSIIDTCTGGMVTVTNAIKAINTVNYEGQDIDITNKNTLRTGVAGPLAIETYSSAKPAAGGWLLTAIRNFKNDFNANFIEEDRYMHILKGLGVTLLLTLCASVFGIVLGFVIAVIRCTNQMTGGLTLLNGISKLYLTIMRGTPVMVQLLILHFVVLSPLGIKAFFSAIICFGLNSGAYVAEIVRGGIMSVDKGQIEAGRSLGFNYVQTMYQFIMPQAFKAILPSLANEFITLLKESSVAFAIGLGDLTFAGNLIRSRTYSPFLPLVTVALIYLAMVLILSGLVHRLERRLAKSDH